MFFFCSNCSCNLSNNNEKLLFFYIIVSFTVIARVSAFKLEYGVTEMFSY